MISMHSVLERGYTWWDRGLFPHDEFEERAKIVQRVMAQSGLDVLTVWSSYYHTDGETAYLAGWPMGGIVVLFADGPPILLSPGGSREHHFAEMQIWCEMRSVPGNLVGGLKKLLDERGLLGGRIGIVRPDAIEVEPYRDFCELIRGFELVDFTDRYQAVMEAKRPREIIAIRNSTQIAEAAIAAAEASFAAGLDTMAAASEAERVARRLGARDFRALVSAGGHSLRPIDPQISGRYMPFLLWVAVDRHGYWGTASTRDTAADVVINVMAAAARTGVTFGEVAAQALSAMPREAHDMALSYGLGGSLGLNLNEGPQLEPGSDLALVEGAVLSLRAYITGEQPSFATKTIVVTANGSRWLTVP